MTDGDGQLTRRGVMALLGAMSGAGAAAAGLSNDTGQGNLSGGTMALSEPYNVAGNLWIGPDSARSQVDAKSGRVYIGASGDGYTFYNGDNGSWDSKGLGDSANPLPSVNTEESVTVQDSQTDPSENGELRNNGGAVKIQTGGSVVEVGSGSGVSGQDDPLAIPSSVTDNAGNGTTWVAVGQNATVSDGRNETVVGDSATGAQDATTVGGGATNRYNGTAVGASVSNGGNNNVLVGLNTTTNGFNNRVVILGKGASVSASDAVAIGENTSVATTGVGRIGVDQLVFGGVQDTIADADLNNSEITLDIDETNSNVIIRVKNSSGTVKTGTVSIA